MNNTVRIEEVSNISIETIKKALIKQYQLEAANDQVVPPIATSDYVEVVKRWIAPCEFTLSIKATVLACAKPGMTEASAQVIDNQLYILANHLENEKQARDILIFGAVGLMAIPKYLSRFNESSLEAIYNALPSDQLETMHEAYGEQVALNKALAVQLYLAELATLDVVPSFYERRDSWQRMLVRKFYPKLKWQSHDFQYLVFRAAKAI